MSDTHWVPTVMLSFVEADDGKLILNQLHVDALGNTQWRAVEVKSQKDLQTGKPYADCKSFSDDDSDTPPF